MRRGREAKTKATPRIINVTTGTERQTGRWGNWHWPAVSDESVNILVFRAQIGERIIVARQTLINGMIAMDNHNVPVFTVGKLMFP